MSLISSRIGAAAVAMSALIMIPVQVFAQSEKCVNSIVQDIGSLNLQEAQSLAVSELIKRSKNNDKNWAAGVTVPIKGVPVSGSAESAESTRERYFRKSTLDWHSERLVSVATQTLSKNAVELYRACVEGQQRSGPRIFVHNATRTEATVTIKWQAPVGAASHTNLSSFDISGGSFKRQFPKRWTTGMSDAVIIRRNPDRDLRVTASIGNESDNVFVSLIPEPPTSRPVLELAYCVGKGGQIGVRLWGPSGANCNGLPPSSGWGDYDAAPREVTQLGSCIGGGGFQGVRLWGPAGDVCAGIPGWGKYENPVDVTASGIANCPGGGNILGGHLLWGPYGQVCAGIPGWGNYTEARTTFTAIVD